MPTLSASIERQVSDRERRGVGVSTPERIMRAGASVIDIEVTTEEGRTITRQRVADWPIAILHRRGNLGREPDGRRRLAIAERLLMHWTQAGLSSLRGRDMAAWVPPSGQPYDGMPSSERQAHHRQVYRAAIDYLRAIPGGGLRKAQVVVMVVLDEVALAGVGLAVFGREHPQSASAVALEYLIDALDALGVHWGM